MALQLPMEIKYASGVKALLRWETMAGIPPCAYRGPC